MKYIDSDKLIAEIERYENTAIDAYNPLGEDADFWNGRVVTCEDIKTFVTSLQQEQPEVEFEKAYKSYMKSRKDDLSGNAVTVNMKDLARHFFELGIHSKQNP